MANEPPAGGSGSSERPLSISPEVPTTRQRLARIFDRTFQWGLTALAVAIFGLIALFVGVLALQSQLTFQKFGFQFLWTQTWDPNRVVFGILPFIDGTLLTSALALLIAVPVSLGVAIFLSEMAPRWLAGPLGLVIELLAAVPSVVFGFWGFIVLKPWMQNSVEPGIQHAVGGWPVVGAWFSGTPTGLDVFTSSVILAIMIIPTISAVSRDSLRAVPTHQREAALSIGATPWESTGFAVVRYAGSGIVGAIVLGLGRAVGETMAVTMTIGNADTVPTSLFSQGQTIASLIANEFGTAQSVPYYQSALIEAGLVLFGITILVNVVARLLVRRVTRFERVAAGV